MKVLIVEDEPDLRLVISVALTQAGHTVMQAGTGEDALREVERDEPDIVFLDLNLPGIDGWEVIERLADRPQVKIVMLTASVSKETEGRALDAGCVGYLSKPFDLDELHAEIARLSADRAS